MAYLDLTLQLPIAAAIAEEGPGFGQEEWTIIALARRDRLASLSEPGLLDRAFAWAFGGNSALKLADPRLETLRRLAVLAWHHGYAVPVSAIKAFLAEGFSGDQLELLLASVSAQRTVMHRPRLA